MNENTEAEIKKDIKAMNEIKKNIDWLNEYGRRKEMEKNPKKEGNE